MTAWGGGDAHRFCPAVPISAEGHLRSPTGAEPLNPASKAACIEAEGHLRGASARAGSTRGPHADRHQSPETPTLTHVRIQNCHQSPETTHAPPTFRHPARSRRMTDASVGEIPEPGFCDCGYASAQNDKGWMSAGWERSQVWPVEPSPQCATRGPFLLARRMPRGSRRHRR